MKRNPFQGALRSWLFDVGSANFVVTGIAMALFSLLFMFDEDEKGYFFVLMYGLAILSTYAGIAWQILRLQAIEWQSLVPDFLRHHQIQCALVYLVTPLIGISIAAIFIDLQTVTALLISMVIGNLFILLCVNKPSYFQMVTVGFILNLFSYSLAATIPVSVALIVVLISSGLVVKQTYNIRFNPTAVSVITDGMKSSGWMVNFKFNFKWLTAFERQLFPVNYFTGPTLSSQLFLAAVVGVAYSGLSVYFAWEVPLVFILLIFSVVLCSMIHWGRLQKPQILELLILLPISSGLHDLRRKLAIVQRRIVFGLSCLTAFMVFIHWCFDNETALSVVLYSFLVCYGSALVAMAVSSIANKIWHLSITMLPVMLLSGWALYGYEKLKELPESLMPLLVNLVLVVIAELLFRWSQTRLKLTQD